MVKEMLADLTGKAASRLVLFHLPLEFHPFAP